ncbi:hypothetical protein [Anaeromyxobacter paludicola]|uniref:Uncharacterized protein n=1 Tax=Anaeromyxobacter paludicola TaxID=2918171 RepID=A0ABM7X6Z9_9BACT|nr:hypothetical protein [Anaeromyxobacter paludicola]BDG07609.1 hypothetical protein AMPC_07220 [Anaeromyxobacter paludicola]
MPRNIAALATCAAVTVAVIVILKTTGLESKLDLSTLFASKSA